MESNRRPRRLETFLVCALIIALAALLSGFLTFRVQFERRKNPAEKKTREFSYQTFLIKEQERKQLHDHFHQLSEDLNLEAWAEKSTCIICHSPYPHGRNLQAIAVMNLHTEFLTCHSCHLHIGEGEEIKFGWISPRGLESKAEPYGVRIDPDTGVFTQTENRFSKLTPYTRVNGEWKPITSDAGVESALAYSEKKDTYSEEQRQAVVDQLHSGTELKEFVRCSRCHSKNGIMDFEDLGFEAGRINQLQKMEISGMLTNYDTFYFPDIFNEAFK